MNVYINDVATTSNIPIKNIESWIKNSTNLKTFNRKVLKIHSLNVHYDIMFSKVYKIV